MSMRTWTHCLVLFYSTIVTTAAADTPGNLIAGKQIAADADLQVGTKLVAIYEKKNYLVEIREVKANKKLKIVWLETKEETDDVLPNELYTIGESTPTRKSRSAVLPEAYRALDKNGDGQIGLYEWNRAKYAEFKLLDKNHDGFLTPQELAVKGATTAAAPTNTNSQPNATSNDSKPMVAPVNLFEHKDKVNESLTLTVTGKVDGGGVWGTDTYSIDSNLVMAAVHAGVLKNGATGAVTVTIVAPAAKFGSSTANGVTTVERNEAGPAFTFKK